MTLFQLIWHEPTVNGRLALVFEIDSRNPVHLRETLEKFCFCLRSRLNHHLAKHFGPHDRAAYEHIAGTARGHTENVS